MIYPFSDGDDLAVYVLLFRSSRSPHSTNASDVNGVSRLRSCGLTRAPPPLPVALWIFGLNIAAISATPFSTFDGTTSCRICSSEWERGTLPFLALGFVGDSACSGGPKFAALVVATFPAASVDDRSDMATFGQVLSFLTVPFLWLTASVDLLPVVSVFLFLFRPSRPPWRQTHAKSQINRKQGGQRQQSAVEDSWRRVVADGWKCDVVVGCSVLEAVLTPLRIPNVPEEEWTEPTKRCGRR